MNFLAIKAPIKILGSSLYWLVILLGTIALVVFIFEYCYSEEDFEPITFTQPTILTNPVIIGQEVELHNGICNETDQQVRIEIWLALKSENPGVIGNQTLDIVGDQTHGFPEDLRPKGEEGDCIAETLIELVRPGTIPPGMWSLTGRIEVMGSQFNRPGEMQRINVHSNVFEVRLPSDRDP